MIKPDTTYIITSRLYQQEEVVKALGIKLRKNEIVNVYADGQNKVRVELYRSPYKRGRGSR